MMKYCDIILLTATSAALLSSAMAIDVTNSCPVSSGLTKSPILHQARDPFVPPVPKPGETCVLWQ